MPPTTPRKPQKSAIFRLWFQIHVAEQRRKRGFAVQGFKFRAAHIHGCIVRIARKRIEQTYSGNSALRKYYKNDFDWGMMNGKLSDRIVEAKLE